MSSISRTVIEPGVVRGEWHHQLDDGRFQCDLCPRYCKLRPGQRGFCFVREAREDGIVLSSYGRASGFAIDPIEKKPLNHFYPGSSILSFGTAGCNLGCRFCQNWHISKARQNDRLNDWVAPEDVADMAVRNGCRSLAFTYNDPIIFAEYAIDCAIAAHDRGLKTVAVTAGYITPDARRDFFTHMDAANVDLKAFTQQFYHKLCFANLEPVLDTLRWLKHETEVWFEVTTLLIPGHNDSETEISQLCDWFVQNLGTDVPLHFSAFHPDFKMMAVPRTPESTLSRARQQAKAAGIHHVYTGNVHDKVGQSTYCANCGQQIIGRNWYHLSDWHLDKNGRCQGCSEPLVGQFLSSPNQWRSSRHHLKPRED